MTGSKTGRGTENERGESLAEKSPSASLRLHATCIALNTAAGPLAVLLRGPSGSGKSDLALRLIDQGAWLVADDQVVLTREGTRLFAASASAECTASPALSWSSTEAIEVRGFGIAALPSLARAPLVLVVDLVPDAEIERLPEEGLAELAGVALPLLALDPFTLSAPAKLRLAVKARSKLIAPPEKSDAVSKDASINNPVTQAGDSDGTGQARDAHQLPVVLVTGLSGAGRATALRALEDIGYEAMDNLPLTLLDQAVAQGHLARPVAIGVDIRSRDFAVDPFLEQLDRLIANPALEVTLLFIDCDDETLQRRFTETRRRHPLAQDRPLLDGIAHERHLLAPLRARCTLLADTSQSSAVQFRRFIADHLSLEDGPGMGVFVTSFSYRKGLPREADLVLDVRFLRNPHYVSELKPLTGRDPEVAAYVESDPAFEPFFDGLVKLLEPLLPRYESEGKSYLTIAIGCTGGQHRSVATAEKLVRWLADRNRIAQLTHRELEAS